MRNRPSHSYLQNRILLFMKNNEFDSLAELARQLEVHRSSASRAMHSLKDDGYVYKAEMRWLLTALGKDEVIYIRRELPVRAAKAVKTANRIIHHSELAGASEEVIAVETAKHHFGLSDALKLTFTPEQCPWQLGSARLEGVESATLKPLLEAAARVDLIASTSGAIKSITSILDTVDTLTLTNEAIQPLVNAAASIDLLTSAQGALQSVASITGKLDITHSLLDSIAPEKKFLSEFGLSPSIHESIRPLVDAATRFDSLVLGEQDWMLSKKMDTEGRIALSAQKAIQPLLGAASRFDSIALGLDAFEKDFSAARELLASAIEPFGVSADLKESLLTRTSGLGKWQNSELSLALDSIASLSLKPTVAEITYGQALHAFGNDAQHMISGLYPRLAQEALTSFNQSARLSFASVEQVSTFGNTDSPILKEFGEANLGLTGIIHDLGTIKMSDWNDKIDLAPLLSNVAEVARTYKGYLADVVGDVAKSAFGEVPGGALLSIPTWTTSAYVGSVKNALVVHDYDLEENSYQESQLVLWGERVEWSAEVFQVLGPNFSSMWYGAWAVLESSNPDRIRQAAHSGRELLQQVLAKLAPDSAFTASEVLNINNNGTATRKMRVRKILSGSSKSTVGWVDAVAKALDETYSQLAAISHDRDTFPRSTEKQLAGLLITLGGLLAFINASQNRNSKERM